MATKTRRKPRTLAQWWHDVTGKAHRSRRAATKRKAERAKRAKERAQDRLTDNATKLQKAETRQVKEQAVKAHRAAAAQKKVARRAAVAAAQPVVQRVQATVIPAPAQAAHTCNYRQTTTRRPCGQQILPNTQACAAGHPQGRMTFAGQVRP
jgi:hypothetical protein